MSNSLQLHGLQHARLPCPSPTPAACSNSCPLSQWCHPTISSFSSVPFSRSVVSDSLWPHRWQHARPPCPSSTPGVYSNSCPLSQWCHPTILCSVIPSPPAFNLSEHQGLFQWVSSSRQVTKVLWASASASVLPMNDWFPLGMTDLISWQSKGLSRVFSNTTVQKHQFFNAQLTL